MSFLMFKRTFLYSILVTCKYKLKKFKEFVINHKYYSWIILTYIIKFILYKYEIRIIYDINRMKYVV